MDTPGYFDFIGDLIGALRVADCSAVVVCAVSGVEVGTEKVWQYADDFSLPRLVLINKLDRENADFTGTIAQLQEHFGLNVVPVQMPIGKEDDFKGVIDLIEEKALLFSDGEKTVEEQEIPAELREQAEAMREKLIEAVAETDDDLLLKYLEGEMLEVEEIKQSLRRGILERKITPVLCGSATRNFGSGPLLDFMKSFLPSPLEHGELSGILPESGEKITRLPSTEEPFTALVYKTLADPYVGRINYFRVYSGVLSPDSQVYNVNKAKNERIGQIFSMRGKNQISMEQVVAGDIAAVAKLQHTTTGDTLCDRSSPFQFPPIEFPEPVISFAVEPRTKGDEEKVSSGLSRFLEEDPTFRLERRAETRETVISGLGELHLEIIVSRLAQKFGVEVDLSTPKAYPTRRRLKAEPRSRESIKNRPGEEVNTDMSSWSWSRYRQAKVFFLKIKFLAA